MCSGGAQDISQPRSGWISGDKPLRPEGTLESGSFLRPAGTNMFAIRNQPLRGWLISVVASRPTALRATAGEWSLLVFISSKG
jgi:hypothetical protein